MARKWLAGVLFVASSVLAEEVRLYPAAISTSLGTVLVTNAVQASSVGIDYGIDEDKERTRLLWTWGLPFERQYGPFRVVSGLEVALGTTLRDGVEQPMANLTPVFEWRLATGPADVLLETGLGVAYLSRTTLGPDGYGTHFQFSHIFGLGVQYRSWQLGARFQHVSNGNIETPNNGQDFIGLMLKYHY